MCKCQYCNATIENNAAIANGWEKVTLANRGGRRAYLCPLHKDYRGDHRYHSTAQTNERGTEKKHGFTFGFELETARPNAKTRAELVSVGFIPTQDITTDTEFVSPIYKSMNPLPKKLATIEKLLNNGDFELTHNEGTHFHVGHSEFINATTNAYMRRFYHSLFVPLSDAMRQNPELTEKLFGRYFVGYASPISEHSEPYAHSNFINLQHMNTIEFRLCKFKNAKQYMNLANFCRDCTNAVINNFIKHFNDDGANAATRKHKADIAAQKMVKLFYKYANNA